MSNSSNNSAFLDEYGVLKLYRQLEPGPHPEIELSRFLVERAGFANTPPPLATIEMTLDDGGGPQQLGLGVLFGFVRNQGDGWTQALNYLTRYLDDALIATDGRSPELPDPDLFFLALARQIGIRTGQMHRALAEQAGNDPDFMPEPITSEDIAEWCSALEINAAEMLSELERERGRLSQRALEQTDQLLAAREMLFLGDLHVAAGRNRCTKEPDPRRLPSWVRSSWYKTTILSLTSRGIRRGH